MAPDIYYRPPSEADSFIVRVMHGCPHNKCTFCNMFKHVRCKAVPLPAVFAGLEQDAEDLGPTLRRHVTSMYLEGGDPLALRTDRLLRIMEHARGCFPELRRFACYATARFIVHKKQQDFDALARAGLKRVFVGLESGCEDILQRIRKKCTRKNLISACRMLAEAGIEVDVSIMLGIGGKTLSDRHAVQTAELLSIINPDCVRIRTFAPKEGTVLGDDCLHGDFALMDPYEILRELHMLVTHITGSMQLFSEHWSNFILFDKHMPERKKELLEDIEKALLQPPEAFRPVGIIAARG